MLFTSSTKTLRISKQIDTARCKGHWNALPDLARRYVKHNPEGAALEQTVLAEVALVQMVQANKPWNPKQALSIQEQLQSVFEINHDLSGELKESAKVILARLFFDRKEYDQVLALLGGLSLLNAQSTGYSFCLYFQSLAIKAMSFEAIGNHESCLKIYQRTVELLKDRQPIKDLTLVEWAEEALHRAIQLVSNHTFSTIVENGTLLELLWAYHRSTCHQPVTWRAERRMGTTLLMIKLLIKLYHSGDYIPHVSSTTDGLPDAYDDQKAFVQEIIQLYTICDLLLKATAPSSITEKGTSMVLDVIESLSVDLDWIIEEKEGWRGYKEILERASERTFNSPSILRLMFFTSLRLGDYEEAQHELQSYLQLVGLLSQDHTESRTEGSAPVQDSCGLYLPLSSPPTLPDTKYNNTTTPSYTSNNMESPDRQVDVLVRAMRLYCSNLKDGVKAVEMADMALALVQKHVPMDPQHAAKVYNSSGVSYGLLASEIIDDGLRPSYHEKALHLLEQANALQHESWKTLYCLAQQHLNMRNIDKAIHYIQHSLIINQSHLPSWHLLVLALSCSGQNNRPQALSAAGTGIEIALDQVSSSTSSADHLEQYLLMKMTYSRLLHASEGPETALEEHSWLFNLYGKWAAILKTEIGNSVNDPLVYGLRSVGGDPWYGCISHGRKEKKPRKTLLSGPFGSVTPTVSTTSLNSHYPLSTTSSSLTTMTTKSSNKFRRRRSASSSMIGNLESTLVIPHCDSASTLPIISDGNKAHLSSLAQRSPSLRKYASNSMLKIPSSHWSNPSTSRSTSLQPSPSQSNHSMAVSMNGSSSNDSISRQSSADRDTYRYSSMYSLQSGNSSCAEGHTTATLASMDGSSNSTTAPTIQPFSLLNQQRRRSALTTSEYLQQHNQNSRLCDLWLMSAEWYHELSDTEEALKAISEAEFVCPTHPGIWCLLGRIKHASTTKNDDASASAAQYFEKGLLLQPGHVDCQIGLAKLYMEQQDHCAAEGILESVTRGFGWHSPEAWYLLGMVYQQTGRKHRTKECLYYALELESVTPICSFDVLPRVV